MISRIEITGVHYEINDELKKYILKKIGNLDSYMSNHTKLSVHAEVKLRQNKSKNKEQFFCEVVLHLPNENIAVHESTISMFAAIDIVESKLKNQLKRYKDKHHPSGSSKIIRKLLGRINK